MQLTLKDVFPLLSLSDAVSVEIKDRQYYLKENGKIDEFIMDHFKNYVVEDVVAYDVDCFSINLLVGPVIKGEQQ